MLDLYTYKANVIAVYDGDTITVDMDLGVDVWIRNEKIRLYGINTPEVRGEERMEGLKVRDYVRSMILGKTIMIRTYKDKTGKYGRLLADIYTLDGNECAEKSLNTVLLELGYAEPYMV